MTRQPGDWTANMIGLILWASTHLTLGFILGRSLNLLNQTLNGLGLVVLGGVVLIVIFTLVKNKKRGSKEKWKPKI